MATTHSLPSRRSRGMRDLLPAQMRAFRRAEDAFREAAQRWGYEEVRTPTIENYSLFTAAGALTPQMLSRVYSFLDWDGWSGERVVLRPDSTIPVSRAVAEGGVASPARVFYVQSVFRFSSEEVEREDWQFGIEYLEAPAAIGDLEVALVASEALAALGLRPSLRISHAGIARGLVESATNGDGPAARELLGRASNGGLGPVLASLGSPGAEAFLKVARSGPGGTGLLANLSGVAASVAPAALPALEELRQLAEALEQAGQRVEVDPALQRDFEYYRGPLFEFVLDGEDWGGGGRYVPSGGDGEATACGLALRVAPIIERLAARSGPRPVVALAPASPGDVARALAAARALHRSGISARLAQGRAEDTVSVTFDGPRTVVRAGGTETSVASLEELVSLLVREK